MAEPSSFNIQYSIPLQYPFNSLPQDPPPLPLPLNAARTELWYTASGGSGGVPLGVARF